MLRPSRQHAGYWAFLLHRLSGLGLALFLPLHFMVLALALDAGDAARAGDALNQFLRWSQQPLVKAAETGLVGLLALHLAGGLRLLALEFLPWREIHKALIATAFGVALSIGLLFALNAA